jgi:hypothetical protein
VKRNATKEEPAYLIRQEDGSEVLKSESELMKGEEAFVNSKYSNQKPTTEKSDWVVVAPVETSCYLRTGKGR